MSAGREPGGLFRTLESRVANPLLRAALRSRIAGYLPDRLVLLSYVGRKTGRRIQTPVMVTPDGDERVVTTYRSVNWWPNFREGHEADLWIDGDPVPVTGSAVTETAAIVDWLLRMRDRGEGRLLQFFDLDPDASEAAIERVAPSVVLVRFRPR